MNGVLPPLPHIPSRRAQGQLCRHITLLY